MKNYDDLQRFKDKTRTGAIEFKDMSGQNQHSDNSNWPIIKQLKHAEDDGSVLSQAGSISVPVPQAVKADAFDASHIKPLSAQPIGNTSAKGSIFESLHSAAPQAKPEALQAEQSKPATTTLFEQLAPLAAATAPLAQEPVPEIVKPAAAPAPQAPAPATPEPVRFDKLFAAKGNMARNHPAKDLPLQPLLEMIASCR